MPLVSRLMFGLVNFAARKGISDAASAAAPPASRKSRAHRTGVRGETFAYWYLRRHGYIFVARNYKVPGMKGEIDLIGYDGEILAFVEVKTRSCDDADAGLPEDAVNKAKRHVISRMARAFLRTTRTHREIYRFDILAIESRRGKRPVVRLHKDAFSEQH
jgi:putative endonuclease